MTFLLPMRKRYLNEMNLFSYDTADVKETAGARAKVALGKCAEQVKSKSV